MSMSTVLSCGHPSLPVISSSLEIQCLKLGLHLPATLAYLLKFKDRASVSAIVIEKVCTKAQEREAIKKEQF